MVGLYGFFYATELNGTIVGYSTPESGALTSNFSVQSELSHSSQNRA
jgi:hypothetical protein